ncbi:MAG: DUF58 domain-containing protein [Rikenellaceae bacterium]
MKTMDNDILKKVRRVEIKTRGLSNEIFAGKYHTAFKGRGMAFSEVREYRIGDDVRDIDWNVTARTRSPHIKMYEEERELTLMLLIDVSGSGVFGTHTMYKRQLATEIAATLAFSAASNNDKVGVILFSDKVEKFIPPKKGRQHVLRIITDLIDFEPESKGTDIAAALKFFVGVQKKRCTAFVLSDFIDGGKITGEDSQILSITSSKHDLVALRLYDKRESEMPNVGIVEVVDSETGEKKWVDTSSAKVRKRYAGHYNAQAIKVASTLSSKKINNIAIATDDDYVMSLIKLFKMR